MATEFYITGLPEWYIRFVIKAVLRKEILCIATAKRNLCGSEILIFGTKVNTQITIRKNEKFFVVPGTESERNFIEKAFWGVPATVYQAEDIFCQTKWKGQPYKFFFKDTTIVK